MKQSTTISKLAQALCRFQNKCHAIEFDSAGVSPEGGTGQHVFKYASYSKIVAAVRPLMVECQLSFSQLVEPDGSVTTLLLHESGEYLKSRLLIPAPDKSPQNMGAAISYARRYGLSAMLGIATDEGNDSATEYRNNGKKGDKKTDASDTRPWLNQRRLEEVIQQMEAGEPNAYPSALKTYRIRRTYRAQLAQVHEHINKIVKP